MAVKVTYTRNGHKETAVGKNAKKLYSKALTANVALGFSKAMAKQKAAAERRQFLILATFFQRLCARTPIDEVYNAKHAPDGVHKPDDDYTRYHWFIKMGNNKPVYASDMISSIGYDVFLHFNDSGSINDILKFLLERYKGKKIFKTFYIRNDTDPDKYRLLEYGGYPKTKYPRIKSGEHYKHGVRNGHSVQAPAGMMRITRGELLSIAESVAKKPLAYRYKSNVTEKNPTGKQLEKIANALKRSGKIKLDDWEKLIK